MIIYLKKDILTQKNQKKYDSGQLNIQMLPILPMCYLDEMTKQNYGTDNV